MLTNSVLLMDRCVYSKAHIAEARQQQEKIAADLIGRERQQRTVLQSELDKAQLNVAMLQASNEHLLSKVAELETILLEVSRPVQASPQISPERPPLPRERPPLPRARRLPGLPTARSDLSAAFNVTGNGPSVVSHSSERQRQPRPQQQPQHQQQPQRHQQQRRRRQQQQPPSQQKRQRQPPQHARSKAQARFLPVYGSVKA